MRKCLIISGGSLDDEFAAAVCADNQYEYRIAADAGAAFFQKKHMEPDLIVGDFDSADSGLIRWTEQIAGEGSDSTGVHRHTERIWLNPVKDDTDTEAALRAAIARGASEVTILGATGTRMDHVLANISLLGIGMEAGVPVQLLDPHNRIRMTDHGLTIPRDEQYGQFLSVIPYSDRVTGVTLCGVKYPLTDYDMGGYNSLGVSNEIIADEAVISFREGVLLIIESKD